MSCFLLVHYIQSEVNVMLLYWQVFEVNVSAATQKKKEELHNRQTQLEREREMLKHNKTE